MLPEIKELALSGDALREVDPRFFWAKKGRDISSRSPLPGWFATTEFSATALASFFPRFSHLIDEQGLLTDFAFDLITLRGPETTSVHPAKALTQADIYMTTAHGWVGRKEVMGALPYLIIPFSNYRVVGINPTLPGFGPSGFKEHIPNSLRTPKVIDMILLEALAAIGVEEPQPGKIAIHGAHSMGPITFLSDRYRLLRDPRYGHVLFDPAFAEVSQVYRLVSYLGLGNAARLLGLPGVKRTLGPQIAKTVARKWGGPHTTSAIENGHLQTIMETDIRTLVYTLLALANERPLDEARRNGRLENTNVLAFIAGRDGFTSDTLAIEGLTSAGLEREKIVHLPTAGHYSFGLEPLFPPQDIPLTQEGLRAWLLDEAQRNPDVARVVGIAQRTARFMDDVFERYQSSVKL